MAGRATSGDLELTARYGLVGDRLCPIDPLPNG